MKLKKTLAPTLAQTGYWYLYAGRVILGFCHGVTFPVMHGLTGHWAPELGQYICIYINCILNYTHYYYYYELVGPVKYILHDYVFTKYLERSKMISIYVTGCSIGTCILFPIAGLLISHWGWPSVFYMTGLVGIIWCAFWYWLAYDR